MIGTLFYLIGGIGLFLLGMSLLTDGLKSYAGDALSRALVRFTGKPSKAFVSGALVTALVQSSSATTVTVIGFVSAGLLTFPQALGVVIGASLGTTSTGWIVSVLGLKISLGYYALPLIGAGALMKLLFPGRWKSLGLALAGFGLIFVGIQHLQIGMEGLSGIFRLSDLPASGLIAHLVIMGIGLIMTIVMQSSSAAVATTLTALYTQSVSFEQAALLVIGAAVGTTVTGAMAAIGASVSTKRTALAHVLFNLATGLIAVLLLPFFLRVILWAQIYLGLDPGATSLAAFHTLFIALGVILFLPFTEKFSLWIERLLPEKGPTLTRHLDPTVLNVPAVALEATRRALSETAAGICGLIHLRLEGRPASVDNSCVGELPQAQDAIKTFFAKIPPVADVEPLSQLRVTQMHAIEHLERLRDYLQPPAVLQRIQEDDSALSEARRIVLSVLKEAQAGLQTGITTEGPIDSGDWLAGVEEKSLTLSELHRRSRPAVLKKTAIDGAPMVALQTLDAIRWMDRVGYHVWRIANYLAGDGSAEPSYSDDRGYPVR
ncbi:MAG: Na/Pi symporter [Smithellaceae bacterium]